jgi:hypothetical protein
MAIAVVAAVLTVAEKAWAAAMESIKRPTCRSESGMKRQSWRLPGDD